MFRVKTIIKLQSIIIFCGVTWVETLKVFIPQPPPPIFFFSTKISNPWLKEASNLHKQSCFHFASRDQVTPVCFNSHTIDIFIVL